MKQPNATATAKTLLQAVADGNAPLSSYAEFLEQHDDELAVGVRWLADKGKSPGHRSSGFVWMTDDKETYYFGGYEHHMQLPQILLGKDLMSTHNSFAEAIHVMAKRVIACGIVP